MRYIVKPHLLKVTQEVSRVFAKHKVDIQDTLVFKTLLIFRNGYQQ